MNRRFNSIYWLIVIIILMLIYGLRSVNIINTFYFISFLVPIALVTSWYFNTILVPKYLLKKRYKRFISLGLVSLIISLDLMMVFVFIAFILLARYQPDQLGELTKQYYSFPAVLYLTVIINGFFNLAQDYLRIAEDIKVLKEQKNGHESGHLKVRSNRQYSIIKYNLIDYIESMSDYVIIRTKENQSIITRETISRLEQRLPSQFLRIHRSYIVNLDNIDSFNREQISISGKDLPISRTYKKKVLEILKTTDTLD